MLFLYGNGSLLMYFIFLGDLPIANVSRPSSSYSNVSTHEHPRGGQTTSQLNARSWQYCRDVEGARSSWVLDGQGVT